MWGSDCLEVLANGHLAIGGCDTMQLAKHYGTPLYVMDRNAICRSLREYKTAMETYCPNGGLVAYASKACSFKEMYRLVQKEGCGADVVSGGELYTALQVGFPADKLYFHGNNKSEAELKMALDAGVSHIIVDNPTELRVLSALAQSCGKSASVMLRITPGIDAHTHEFIRTGKIDSKFGFTLQTGEALESVGEALKLPGIDLKGLHCHIGSQIFEEEPFAHAAEVMIGFMNQIRESYGVTLGELNLGGGFGIRYVESDTPRPVGEYIRLMTDALKQCAEKYAFPVPSLVIEPGRAVAAPAGITLYTVGAVKTIPGVRTYVSVDGGMTDNPRYALYQADYTVLAANRANQPADTQVTIAGRCCESGDLIQENTPLPSCRRGDILAVLATGAYNYSMSSNYNRLPRPAVVMTDNGTSDVVVKAETYQDLIRNDM